MSPNEKVGPWQMIVELTYWLSTLHTKVPFRCSVLNIPLSQGSLPNQEMVQTWQCQKSTQVNKSKFENTETMQKAKNNTHETTSIVMIYILRSIEADIMSIKQK